MIVSEIDESHKAVAKVLAQAVRDLFTPYVKALEGDPGGVHRVRVATRRLRVALRLLADHPGGKRRRRSDRILQRIGRALAMSRDLDVGVALFESFLPKSRPARSHCEGLRRSLIAARAQRRRQSKERLLDLELAALRRDLRALSARDPIGVDTFRLRLGTQIDAGGAKLMDLIRVAGRRLRPEALHAARRQARRLRYLAEIADTLLDYDSGAPKTWRSLQRDIGKIHDRHVFAIWLGVQRTKAARAGDVDRERAARAMQTRVLRDARQLHRELLATDPAGRAVHALHAMRPKNPVAEQAETAEHPVAEHPDADGVL